MEIYTESYDFAYANHQLSVWKDSYAKNKTCVAYVRDRLETAYQKHTICGLAAEAAQLYGVERMLFALARTVQCYEWDVSFSKEVIARARRYDFTSHIYKDYSLNFILMNENLEAINLLYEALIGLERNPAAARHEDVYPNSYEFAKSKDELPLWQKSYERNLQLKSEILEYSDTTGTKMPTGQYLNYLIMKYGADRIMYVLSRTVQEYPNDESFFSAVRKCSKSFSYPDMWDHCADRTLDYIIDGHAGVVNTLLYKMVEINKPKAA